MTLRLSESWRALRITERAEAFLSRFPGHGPPARVSRPRTRVPKYGSNNRLASRILNRVPPHPGFKPEGSQEVARAGAKDFRSRFGPNRTRKRWAERIPYPIRRLVVDTGRPRELNCSALRGLDSLRGQPPDPIGGRSADRHAIHRSSVQRGELPAERIRFLRWSWRGAAGPNRPKGEAAGFCGDWASRGWCPNPN